MSGSAGHQCFLATQSPLSGESSPDACVVVQWMVGYRDGSAALFQWVGGKAELGEPGVGFVWGQ
eukprot:scaffold119660_cov17-Tisochrysis_lutea.AAC.1